MRAKGLARWLLSGQDQNCQAMILARVAADGFDDPLNALPRLTAGVLLLCPPQIDTQRACD